MGGKNSKSNVEKTEMTQKQKFIHSSQRHMDNMINNSDSFETQGEKLVPCIKRHPRFPPLGHEHHHHCVPVEHVPESSRPRTTRHCRFGEVTVMGENSDDCLMCVNLKSDSTSGLSSVVTQEMMDKAQEDVSLEELSEVVAKLQQTVLQLNQRFPSEDNFYIQQVCKTLGHSVNLLKNQTPTTVGSRCIGTPEVVEKKKKGKGPDSIDSTSSKFVSLTNQISMSILMRLVTKLPKKNKKHTERKDLSTIWERLSGLVAAELDACDCDLLRVEANIKDITKNMVRNLLKTFGSSESLLRAAMSPENPAFDKAVMNFLRWKLKVPKKKNVVSRFLSAIGSSFRG